MEVKIISKNYRPKKVRVRSKGQFTIPFEFREKIGIREDTVLDVYNFGKVIIATPEKPVVKELAAAVREEMEEYKVNLDDLLAELREGRHEYSKED